MALYLALVLAALTESCLLYEVIEWYYFCWSCLISFQICMIDSSSKDNSFGLPVSSLMSLFIFYIKCNRQIGICNSPTMLISSVQLNSALRTICFPQELHWHEFRLIIRIGALNKSEVIPSVLSYISRKAQLTLDHFTWVIRWISPSRNEVVLDLIKSKPSWLTRDRDGFTFLTS